jgi:hypothetical protein
MEETGEEFLFISREESVRDISLLRRMQAGCRSNQTGSGIYIREDDNESSCQWSNVWISSYTFTTWYLFKNRNKRP